MKWLCGALLSLGGLVCLTNFWLSFVRYPIHRARGLAREQYRFVSGVPLLGSILVALGWAGLHESASTWLDVAALALAGLDTGGLHWFLIVMAWRSLPSNRE